MSMATVLGRSTKLHYSLFSIFKHHLPMLFGIFSGTIKSTVMISFVLLRILKTKWVTSYWNLDRYLNLCINLIMSRTFGLWLSRKQGRNCRPDLLRLDFGLRLPVLIKILHTTPKMYLTGRQMKIHKKCQNNTWNYFSKVFKPLLSVSTTRSTSSRATLNITSTTSTFTILMWVEDSENQVLDS